VAFSSTRRLRKTIWLCLSYALFVTQETEILNELEQIIDYVSGKARLLAEECIALLTLHVAPHPLPLLHPLLSCAFNTLAGEDDPVQGIIVAHGRSTASSIAGIANQLTGGYYFKAFDMLILSPRAR
jgi:hypothetical protein